STVCLQCSRAHPHLRSFPTRRSSDLLGARLPQRAGDGVWRGVDHVEARLRWRGLRAQAQRRVNYAATLLAAELEQVLPGRGYLRSEEHTSELQSRSDLVCRLLLEKKK